MEPRFSYHVRSETFNNLLLQCRPPLGLCASRLNILRSKMRIGGKFSEQEWVDVNNSVEPRFPDDYCRVVYHLTKSYLSRCDLISEDEVELPSYFLLLSLFIQMYTVDNSRMRRSRSVELLALEPWPNQTTRDRSADARKPSDGSAKKNEEEIQVTFLQSRSQEFRKLFLEGVSLESATQILEFMFSALCKEEDDLHSRSGRFKTVTIGQMCRDLKEVNKLFDKIILNLQVSSCGILSTIMLGKWLSWPLGLTVPTVDRDKQTVPLQNGPDHNNFFPAQKPKMAVNANFAPNNKMVVISKLINRLLARRSDTLKNARVEIHRSRNSFFYLLSPLESLVVAKSINLTIVTGPVRGIVSLRSCKNIKLMTLADFVMVSESVESSLLTGSQHPVIIDGDTCSNISLGPYAVGYRGLEKDLASFGMTRLECGRDPIVLASDGFGQNVRKFDVYRHVPEGPNFISPPFAELHQASSQIQKYLQPEIECRNRMETIRELKMYLDSVDLEPCEVEEVEEQIVARFRSWLIATDGSSELRGLQSLRNQTN